MPPHSFSPLRSPQLTSLPAPARPLSRFALFLLPRRRFLSKSRALVGLSAPCIIPPKSYPPFSLLCGRFQSARPPPVCIKQRLISSRRAAGIEAQANFGGTGKVGGGEGGGSSGGGISLSTAV